MSTDRSAWPTWMASLDERGTTCTSCRAACYWCRTTSGAKMLVDQATKDGKLVSHFATCPDAKKHRKPRPPR